MEVRKSNIRTIYLLLIIFVFILSACNAGGDTSNSSAGSVDKTSEQLADQEVEQDEELKNNTKDEELETEITKEGKDDEGNKKADKEDENDKTTKADKNSKDKVEKNSESEKTTTSNNKKDSITTKTETTTKTIKHKTVKQNDNSLEKGKTKVVQNGQNGTRTITYKVTYKNGKEVSREQVSSKVTKKAIDKIVKVGTKETKNNVTYISASEAHNILENSGMRRAGNEYYLELSSMSSDLVVWVGSNHVTGISFNPSAYIPWKVGTLKELQDTLGKDEGKEQYDYGQAQAKKIEKAVRAAANAVYGSGTTEANKLYNTIINKALKENKFSSCTFNKNGQHCEFG